VERSWPLGYSICPKSLQNGLSGTKDDLLSPTKAAQLSCTEINPDRNNHTIRYNQCSTTQIPYNTQHTRLSLSLTEHRNLPIYASHISLSTVLLHVAFGLPFFLLPSGVQCNAVLVIDCGSLRRMCPIHFHHRLVMMVPMSFCLHLHSRSSLEIFSGQKIRRILCRHMVWKDRSLVRSTSVILQHSEPYRSVDTTQLWYSFSLVLVLYWVDLQILFISLNHGTNKLGELKTEKKNPDVVAAYAKADISRNRCYCCHMTMNDLWNETPQPRLWRWKGPWFIWGYFCVTDVTTLHLIFFF